jgi:hypothetical protein
MLPMLEQHLCVSGQGPCLACGVVRSILFFSARWGFRTKSSWTSRCMSLSMLWICSHSGGVCVVPRVCRRVDASATWIVRVVVILVNEMVLLKCSND